MEAGANEEETPVRRPRRWRRLGVALLSLAAVALAGLWLDRKPLATRYADRFLADKHVPARYRIVDLGLGRQRLEQVVIGDPADPDLVADWLEARTAIGLRGPYLTGVRGGRVRVRARWADGKLSLGSIDRLLPQGQAGKPFALPALTLDVADLRARVETPWGLLGAKLTGSGRLDGGFAGKLALTAPRVGVAGCGAAGPRLALQVRTTAATPLGPARVRLEGSGEAAGLACSGARAGYANWSGNGEVRLLRSLSWSATVDVAANTPSYQRTMAKSFSGHLALLGGGTEVAGDVALRARQLEASPLNAGEGMAKGHFYHDRAKGVSLAYRGTAGVAQASWRLPDLTRLARAAAGTPAAPLLQQAASSTVAAARRFQAQSTVTLTVERWGTMLQVHRAAAHSTSGAVMTFESERDFPTGIPVSLAGTLRTAGGGLPATTIRFVQPRGDTWRGVATIEPYAADGARMALAATGFSYAPGGWRVTTRATLTGPLPGGRVDALTLPIDARGRGSSVMLAGGCVPVSWQRLAVSGLLLDPATLRLCGNAGALVTVASGHVAGGATLGATRLTGRLGGTPLTLAATGARLQLAGQRLALSGVAARLGRPERVTTLTAATLDGTLGTQGVSGTFAGAGGQIGAVPLAMSGAAGTWRFTAGTLAVDGELTVSDAQTDRPRFKPLPVRAVAFTLKGNAIAATGQLRAPDALRPVADLRLTHDLAAGTGAARFTVPTLTFDKQLQPDQLTPVTFGVVADVRGTVTGGGRIDWTPAGVTSTGSFTTEGTDLAAAFGPVQGIAGTIRFTDLLALESAPDQVFHVREVNPGIAVNDGTVTFRTLRDARVAVAGAHWPFAGGTLTLEPTLLDFGEQGRRRLTFRVAGAAADQFLQQFDFKNLDATGTFDGVLPMAFDEAGGRIEDGHLTVRPGGGTLAYVGAISQKDVGFWPNLAFQALKSLRYRSLAIRMNGPLAGEMVTEVRFAGVSQGEGARKGGIAGLLVGRLQRLPFIFNIRIQAPFRGLLDSAASFYDPRRLIQRNLPQLIEEQNKRAPPPAKPIQPPASETVP